MHKFKTPVTANIPDVWNRNSWTLFSSEIEQGAHGPSAPTPLAATPLLFDVNSKFVFKRLFCGVAGVKFIVPKPAI